MSQEARHAAMQRATDAGTLMALAGPVIQEQIDATISLLVGNYRGEKIDHDLMVGKIAEISALQGLLSSLESLIRKGEYAMEQEINDGQKARNPRS